MPENDETQQQNAVETSETDDATTDWKAKAREWEKRAKDNMTRIKEAEPKLAEYDRLIQASKSELELAREQATGYQERATKAERDAMVATIALDKGLPAALARRLQGSTPEELQADADELLAQFPASQETTARRAPRPDTSQGSSARGGAPASPADEFASIIRSQIGS